VPHVTDLGNQHDGTAFNLVARCAITAVLLVAALASAQVTGASGA
jgi:hypothetical protein